MLNEPLWLPADEVIETNKDVVSETGESFAVINRSGLEIALASPMNRFAFGETDNVIELAVVLLFSLVRNHPFEQGNKRTALVSAIQFMQANGFTVVLPDTKELGELIVAVIEGAMTEAEFLEFISPYVVPFDD